MDSDTNGWELLVLREESTAPRLTSRTGYAASGSRSRPGCPSALSFAATFRGPFPSAFHAAPPDVFSLSLSLSLSRARAHVRTKKGDDFGPFASSCGACDPRVPSASPLPRRPSRFGRPGRVARKRRLLFSRASLEKSKSAGGSEGEPGASSRLGGCVKNAW